MNRTERFLLPLRAALAAALAAGLTEGAWATAAGAEPLARFVVGAGLWIAALPLLYLVFLFVQWGAYSVSGQALRRRWSTAPEEITAGALLVGGFITGLGVGLPWAHSVVSKAVRDADLVPPAITVAAVLFTFFALVVGLYAFGLVSALLRRLPPFSLGLLTVAGLIGPGVWVVWEPIGVLGKDVPLQPGYLVTLALLVGLGTLAVARKPRFVIGGVALLGAALFAAAAFAPSLYGSAPAVRLAFADGHGVVPHFVKRVHDATDGDGDGFSPYLAGGDCDDGDDGVHPMALDIPGNDLDEDCREGDRRPHRSIKRAKVKRPPLPKALVRRWNVLFITVDSLRPDRLDAYGYERITAPNITTLAAEGLLFERAYTAANNTRFAIPTMFSGRAVADLDAERLGLYTVLGPRNEFIFDRLRRAGWHAEAHLPQQLYEGMWYGFDRSFHIYRGHPSAKLKKFSAGVMAQVTIAAIRRLAKGKRPWTLWAHFVDPHEPYRIHKGHDFGDSERDRYDSEVAGTDAAIGRIMAALEKTGERADTIIIVTSDHGEEFAEHGRRFHGKQLFEESIRVPLVVSIPGAPAHRVAESVSLLDIPETVGHLTGLKAGADYGNISLAAVLAGRTLSPDRSLFCECIRNPADIRRRQVTLIRGDGKAIVTAGRDRDRLYDLGEDPEEKINVSGDPPAAIARHLGELRAEMRRQEETLLAQMRSHHVSRKAPPGLGEPMEMAPGLELLGANLAIREFGVEKTLFLRTWLRATGDRKNYRLRFEVVDADGSVVRKWTVRPLLGLYSTEQWAEGEVVEESRVIRVRKLSGTVSVRVKLLAKKETVFGPHVLAEYALDE